ncbi:MAG: hypothetical protein R2746_10175 [Acidimicrobiales bacterium]
MAERPLADAVVTGLGSLSGPTVGADELWSALVALGTRPDLPRARGVRAPSVDGAAPRSEPPGSPSWPWWPAASPTTTPARRWTTPSGWRW